MNVVFCDRCGAKCEEGSAYYTISVYGFDVNPTNDGRISLDAATQNIATNMEKVSGKERHYCKKCKDEIVKFMSSDEQHINTLSPEETQEYIKKMRW